MIGIVVKSLLMNVVIFLFRPIAGNINVCPRRLRSDHHTIDFDRLVSTIKHEILHTLVNFLHFCQMIRNHRFQKGFFFGSLRFLS